MMRFSLIIIASILRFQHATAFRMTGMGNDKINSLKISPVD